MSCGWYWHSANQNMLWYCENLDKCSSHSKFESKLILLGTLESNGCKYSTKGEVLKVINGAFVFTKGVRHGILKYAMVCTKPNLSYALVL